MRFSKKCSSLTRTRTFLTLVAYAPATASRKDRKFLYLIIMLPFVKVNLSHWLSKEKCIPALYKRQTTLQFPQCTLPHHLNWQVVFDYDSGFPQTDRVIIFFYLRGRLSPFRYIKTLEEIRQLGYIGSPRAETFPAMQISNRQTKKQHQPRPAFLIPSQYLVHFHYNIVLFQILENYPSMSSSDPRRQKKRAWEKLEAVFTLPSTSTRGELFYKYAQDVHCGSGATFLGTLARLFDELSSSEVIARLNAEILLRNRSHRVGNYLRVGLCARDADLVWKAYLKHDCKWEKVKQPNSKELQNFKVSSDLEKIVLTLVEQSPLVQIE